MTFYSIVLLLSQSLLHIFILSIFTNCLCIASRSVCLLDLFISSSMLILLSMLSFFGLLCIYMHLRTVFDHFLGSMGIFISAIWKNEPYRRIFMFARLTEHKLEATQYFSFKIYKINKFTKCNRIG